MRLKEIRQIKKLSLKELSAMTGIQSSKLSSWENGITPISNDGLKILARVLNTSEEFIKN